MPNAQALFLTTDHYRLTTRPWTLELGPSTLDIGHWIFPHPAPLAYNAAMSNDSLARLTNLFLAFRDARDWKQFHNPKELAVSLVVESAEFLELFQWKTGPELDRVLKTRQEDIADELADVLHSLLLLAHDLNIDLAAAVERKIRKMERKYPVDKSKGKPRKYDDLD